MSTIQDKLLNLLKGQGSAPLKYRELGRRIGEKYPQTVKHHIEALKKKNLIEEKNGFLVLVKKNVRDEKFLTLPFYGLVNCGPATIFADDKIEGYIKISKNIFPKKNIKKLYLIKASGNSMDEAQIGRNKRSIEDGDFVVVDANDRDPVNGDYILSIIDNCANIKKYKYDEDDNRVVLVSESSDEYFPIVLHESDNFVVVGKIIDVLKNLS
jgi:SOS-response transcriptional repressor LexA